MESHVAVCQSPSICPKHDIDNCNHPKDYSQDHQYFEPPAAEQVLQKNSKKISNNFIHDCFAKLLTISSSISFFALSMAINIYLFKIGRRRQ